MSFNYRVVRQGEEFAVHEVFYHEDGTVAGWTDPLSVTAPTVDDLRFELEKYLRALELPVLQVEE